MRASIIELDRLANTVASQRMVTSSSALVG